MDKVEVLLVGMHGMCSECAQILQPRPMKKGERHVLLECMNSQCSLHAVQLRFELPVVQCERVAH